MPNVQFTANKLQIPWPSISILALPIIGTLDSSRTQLIMEALLNEIVATGSGIAILDISGVPAVDSLVAQHLIKTVSATRLMGAGHQPIRYHHQGQPGKRFAVCFSEP
jgi:anti-anti-sigma regulatory factor